MNSFLNSFSFALNGIKISLRQRNMKIHVACALLVIALGFYFKITTTDWCILLLCIGVVIALEIINTAIEHVVDLVSPNYNELAGKVKDLAAGAVLVVAIISAIVGCVIFWNYV